MRTATPWLATVLFGWIGLAGCDAPSSPGSKPAAAPPPAQAQPAAASQGMQPLAPDQLTPPADSPRNEAGIAWKVLSPGTGKDHPTPSHFVSFHVAGWHGDGRPLMDTRSMGQPAAGPMGRNYKSWVEALGMMVVGERRRFWIPVEAFHYGKPARPGTLMVFDFELLEIGELNRPADLTAEQAEVVFAFNRLYAGTHIKSRNINWLGVEIQQNPCDLIMMQQIIYELRPDLIIETGTYTGGGAFYYATLLELIAPEKGKVVTVDIKPMVDEVAKRPAFSKRVEVITGDSVSDETIAKLTAYAGKAETVLVTLDSLHTAEHVAKELERYAPLVTKGSYLVVQDTYVNDFFPGAGSVKNEPIKAVEAFIKTHPEFIQDRERERLLLSAYRGGYLKRIK